MANMVYSLIKGNAGFVSSTVVDSETRFPSGTLSPFVFLGSLIKTN